MLPNEKNDLMYLLNIIEYIGKIWNYPKNIKDAEDLYEKDNQMVFNASLTLLANIGENVSKISDKTKQDFSDIERQKIKDFRNRIVHDYIGLDLVVVYDIITIELPRIKPLIEKIIRNRLELQIFDIEEVKLCENSSYYRHVDFEILK